MAVDDDQSVVEFPDEGSSSSESSDGCHIDLQGLRREKLNQFLTVCGKEERVPGHPKKSWEKLSNQRKNIYVTRATTAIVTALEVIAPGDAGHLWTAVQSSRCVETALGMDDNIDRKYLEALAETYQHATSWDTRRQVLAIIADLVPYRDIQKFIPGLTDYRIKEARMHILKYGRGAAVPLTKSPRMRVNESQLDHFLTFITSSHVVQDLPFGQRYLHLENGQVLETPNVIRAMIPQRIIEQYTQFCKEDDMKPLSPATISRLLTVCAATVRKSLQGLDYIAADGAKAFDDLSAVAVKLKDKCVCDGEWFSYCQEALKAGKQYIKTEYKVCLVVYARNLSKIFFSFALDITSLFKQVHITQGSRVADHCAVYALSDPKEDHFQGTCDHAHDQSCSSCEGLDSVLSSIEASVRHKTSNLSDEERDDMMYSCQQAVQAIHTWKAHQLRVLQQDKCRIDVLQELNFNEVLITQDWAMKFLPLKYRETQTDWFGKRGISWHISVVVRRETGGNLQHQAFVHIAKNCSQDSNVVAAIMEHILRNLSNEHPEITTAYFRQDNAGCYKSAAMLAACPLMQKTTGINVRRVDFSDPQGGKGSCDRKAATIKAHVRRFVNEGHDVLTADDFRDAILSNNGVRGVRVAVVNCEFLAPAQPVKWEGVSSINNLSYQVTGVTVWKAYDVGKGKTILRTQLQGKVKSF